MMGITLDPAPEKTERLLCAVSGGADSMCLLHLLHTGGYDVTAAHFEHGIRGTESLRDANFVEAWCAGHGIPFVLGHGDAPKHAAEKGLSLEEAARELRYTFLLQAAEKLGAAHILTAHTLDDNAETLLFNLTRGSGTAGLCGIPARRDLLLRPLLHVSRAEIEEYLKKNGVPHVEDSSNGSDDYTRNLIRHRVVPLLRQINPRFADAAARMARLARQDEDCLSALADKFLREQLSDGSLPLNTLAALHPAVASRVVRQLLPGQSLERVEAVLDFIQSSEYGVLQLPGQVLRREQGRLYFEEERAARLPARRLIPGEALLIPEAGLRLVTEFTVYRGEIHDLFKTSFLKYEILSTDLLCTGRMPGDSIRPHGRGVRKKLSALFKEAGYTRAQREGCLVLRDANGPLFVRGLAIDERAVPRPGECALKLRFFETETKKYTGDIQNAQRY